MKGSFKLTVVGTLYMVVVCYFLSGGNPTVFVWLMIILSISMVIGIVVGVWAMNEKITKMFDDGEDGNDG